MACRAHLFPGDGIVKLLADVAQILIVRARLGWFAREDIHRIIREFRRAVGLGGQDIPSDKDSRCQSKQTMHGGLGAISLR
jgi:hypothetical protein